MKNSNQHCHQSEMDIEKVLDGGCTCQNEREKILDHLNSCPQCHEKYMQEKRFKDFIQCKVERKKCSPWFVSELKNLFSRRTFFW